MDQELADAAAYAAGRRCVSTPQVAALFSVKWRYGRHLGLLHSIRIYSRNNIAQLHPGPIWNDGDVCPFEEGHPQQQQNEEQQKDD